MNKILELKEKITAYNVRSNELIDLAKAETRDLTEVENKEIEEIRTNIENAKAEIAQLESEEQRKVEQLKNNKNNFSKNMKKEISIVKEIRNSIDNNQKSITLAAETRAMQVTGVSGVHDEVVETEIQGILEPLYANSVLAQLGARFYSGLPMGDVQIPVMSGSTIKWEGETDAADATGNAFTSIKLTPKRLSAYVDISKQLLYQDTIGVEAAVRRDLINALNAKLEATIFDASAGTTERPAGLLYGAESTNIDDFAGLCAFEAALENNNIFGELKYVMSPSAKAVFRGMLKGTNATGMVYENGEMDGTPTFVTTAIASKKFIYGDFSNLVIGVWGPIDITVDPYSQAANGCIRLVINFFVDFKPARAIAFTVGDVD